MKSIIVLTIFVRLASFTLLGGNNAWGAPPPAEIMGDSLHIVVLIADDLGVGFAPCLTNSEHMPWLSRLCDKALVFKRAYTHPVCTPSRAAMMTGRHTFRTQSGDTKQSVFKLDLEEVTIPELIRSHSSIPYNFAAFGKWHLASDNTGGILNPNLQGFNHFEGNPRQHHTYRYTDYEWVINGKRVGEHTKKYKTTQIVDRVIVHFSDYASDSPWFYWVGFVNPHLPFHLPPTALHEFDNLPPVTFKSVWHEPQSKREIRINRPASQVVPYYKAMIQALDTELRRLITTLSEKSNRPILFIFLGDNGDAGEIAPNHRTGLRGTKATLYEVGVRVPLMVWSTAPTWAKHYAGETERLTHLADLFPTLTQVAGVSRQTFNDLPFVIDGISFFPMISSASPVSQPLNIYLQHGNERGLPFAFAALTDKGHKLILREFNRRVGYSADIVEFYNLSVDPGESNNLFPDICKSDASQFWNLFNYISNLHATEKSSYSSFDKILYQRYILKQFSRKGCAVGG